MNRVNRVHPPPQIAIEYDSRGKRISRRFADLHLARRFYVAKHLAGKRPKVVKPQAK